MDRFLVNFNSQLLLLFPEEGEEALALVVEGPGQNGVFFE